MHITTVPHSIHLLISTSLSLTQDLHLQALLRPSPSILQNNSTVYTVLRTPRTLPYYPDMLKRSLSQACLPLTEQ